MTREGYGHRRGKVALAVLLALSGVRGGTQQIPAAKAGLLSPQAAAKQAADSGAAVAARVRRLGPAGTASGIADPQPLRFPPSYESGALLDGLAAQWQATAEGEDYAFLQATVDRWVGKDGSLHLPYAETSTPKPQVLAGLTPGRAVLLCYRVTGQERYAKAASFLFALLRTRSHTPEAELGQKRAGTQPMWLPDPYKAEPFLAAFASTFQRAAEFDEVAAQLLLLERDLHDPRNGLPHPGGSAHPPQQGVAKASGSSPEAEETQQIRLRAISGYAAALVDTLPWFPEEHPARAQLKAALLRIAEEVAKDQGKSTSLGLHVFDRGRQDGNLREASARAKLVYALAKGVRLGYLPLRFEPVAIAGWNGLQQESIVRAANSTLARPGTVKTGAPEGTPSRAGQNADELREPMEGIDSDAAGAFLLAASELEQSATEHQAQGKLVLVDGWFNAQTRKNAEGQTELFHYKFDDDRDSGFSFFGRAFQRYGARLGVLREAPTMAGLAKAAVYIVPSPDIPSKNPRPNYMDAASGDAIEAWVRKGGVLLLMQNDKANAEFEHFNTLTERFGIHFNAVVRNTVEGSKFEQGRLIIPAGTGGIYPKPLEVYMKDICTITLSGPAKQVFTDKGDTLMAVAKIGKGVVYAVVDPWLYNEYTDGRKLPQGYQDFQAARDLAGWALQQAR